MTGNKVRPILSAGGLAVALLAALVGCPTAPVSSGVDETPIDPSAPTFTTIEDASGWCAVRAMFAAACVGCHDAAQRQGDLDLETDPYGATVGVVSPDFGVVLVQPGDPDGSLLYRKMAG